ncbi:flagellar protein FliT [Marinobacterium rhizophilum]|uniref:Flagellar protein FliT n=1 Tax=Marinobacterium rhizophilum TaxID=420402 RepID=A0ABY5HCH9_9GAMM|nr:flagellar protein FliT [Marinobacterium rhizophilum]UTW10050.1 flagellar protein FliT [Marinobacterium rhizophilum]
MNPSREIAEQLLKATDALLARARSEDFENLAPLQHTRATLIEQLDHSLGSKLSVTEATELAEILQQVRSLEDDTQALLQSRKKTLLDEHHKLKKGQRAQKAYGNMG